MLPIITSSRISCGTVVFFQKARNLSLSLLINDANFILKDKGTILSTNDKKNSGKRKFTKARQYNEFHL